MSKNLNLFEILQNPAIGVIAIHSFIIGYNNVAKHKDGKENYPPLNQLFYILPIIYDISAMKSIKNELYTTLTENKNLTLELEERARKMSGQTFESLNLGFSKLIFKLNRKNFTVEIEKEYEKNILDMMKIGVESLRNIQTYSKRLGNIFAKKDEKRLQIDLKIRF
ncbi:hypothetical protein SAMN06265171_105174 [Chryseobacterium rhizoplanae]|uniref:Uncharacterized protein n=1 Tax=Chryseobacterium rhizoplanae TaxID=1609531 RepID=A0A521DJL3_9FLAO|nr:three component ABC system middle component [Chryseobacterium rhizoplanae]SMO71772.1 hypothetical protein SAMN06265171_105174 [Chryseobacterium rhizoplanae]